MRNKYENQTNDDILRNCFTGYLASAVQHRRADYFVEEERYQTINGHMEKIYYPESFNLDAEALKDLPIAMKMENEALLMAFLSLDERERYVLLKRIVDEVSIEDLAEDLSLGYKGAAAVYYRAVKKIKRKMKGE